MRFYPARQQGFRRNFNDALNHACPIPEAQGSTQDKLSILRGQLVLASIAGYASRSISSYAVGNDGQLDGTLVLQRLQVAEDELNKAAKAAENGNHLLPLYRADLIAVAGSASEAVMRPSDRVAKATSLSTSISSDSILQAKSKLLNMLVNEIYVEALQESCTRLNNMLGDYGPKVGVNGSKVITFNLKPQSEAEIIKAKTYTDERFTDRCTKLKMLVSNTNNGDKYCEVKLP
jgi:hypothetical protein